MRTTIGPPSTKVRQVTASLFVIFLSVALPAGILCWSINAFLANRPIGRASQELPVFSFGGVKNGELWFPVFRFPHGVWQLPYDCRIVKLDLSTGAVNETELQVADQTVQVVWRDDELYVLGENAIYRKNGAALEKIGSMLPPSRNLSVKPFFYNGQLTTVVQILPLIGVGGVIPVQGHNDDEFQLVHLVEGEWVNGRKILLPGINRTWYDDPVLGRRSLLPRTSFTPSRWTGLNLTLSVSQRGEDVDLFYSDNISSPLRPIFTAYRNGFEFADRPDDEVSALAPENFLRDVSGWEPMPSLANGEWWVQMACNRSRVIFELNPFHFDLPYAFVQRDTMGKWTDLHGAETVQTRSPLTCSLISDPASDDAYIVRHMTNWNSASICRIEGTTILEPQLTIPSEEENQYLDRIRWLFAGLSFAWLLHCGVLIVGIDWLTSRSINSGYQFGLQKAVLASNWRRALSLAVDVMVLVVVLYATVSINSRVFGWSWKQSTGRQICDSFIEFEWDHFNQLADHHFNPFHPWSFRPYDLVLFMNQFKDMISSAIFGHPDEAAWKAILLAGLVLFCARTMLEGFTGFTPGKWLLGIRTVRSTLRPCGLSRAIVRDAMLFVDILFAVSPIPAAISMMVSPCKSRLGDRFADTVVVRTAGLEMLKTEKALAV